MVSWRGFWGPRGARCPRLGAQGGKTARQFQIAGLRGVVLSGKAALEQVSSACATADIVLLPARLGPTTEHPAGCTVIDAAYLAQSGAIAGLPDKDGIMLQPVRAEARVWSGNAVPTPALHIALNPSRLAQGGGN
jgi:competence protein ComEC